MKLQGFLGPSKIHITFKTEAKLRKYKLAVKKKLNSEPLKSREELQRAMLITGMNPYQKFRPLLNTKERQVTTLTEYTVTIKKGLNDATGEDNKECKPKPLRLDSADED